AYLTFVHVEFTEGDAQDYLLPLAARLPEEAAGLTPAALIARLETDEGERILIDALWEPALARSLLDALSRRRRLNGMGGKLAAVPTRALAKIRGRARPEDLEPQVLSA